MSIGEWVCSTKVLALTMLSIGLFTVLVGFSLTVQRSSAIQSSTDVELTIPQTRVAFSGYAAPSGLVKVVKNESIVATTVANSLGYYTTEFTHQSGVHEFELFYTDIRGVESSRSTVSISISSQQTTQKTVYLSPTISLGSQKNVSKGSVIKVFGYSAASSSVALSLDYASETFSATSDASGYYEYFLDTSRMRIGEHLLTSTVTIGTNKSASSPIVRFTVDDSSTVNQSSPDLIVGPAVISPPVILLPEDGAVIESDSVEIIGEAPPGSQINVYQDGELYGSFFADEDGRWKFIFSPTYTPVTLSFETCVEGTCSILSRTITLSFPDLAKQCIDTPSLGDYRFWGVDTSEEVALVMNSSFAGTIEINWGDGKVERFSYDDISSREFKNSYSKSGNYQGKILFSTDQCVYEKYFSVHVVQAEKDSRQYTFIILFIGLLIGAYLSKRDLLDTKRN